MYIRLLSQGLILGVAAAYNVFDLYMNCPTVPVICYSVSFGFFGMTFFLQTKALCKLGHELKESKAAAKERMMERMASAASYVEDRTCFKAKILGERLDDQVNFQIGPQLSVPHIIGFLHI